jgi:hypothetical protein
MALYFISHAYRRDLRMLTNTGSYPSNLHLLAQIFSLSWLGFQYHMPWGQLSALASVSGTCQKFQNIHNNLLIVS